jgi:hypothetical protein
MVAELVQSPRQNIRNTVLTFDISVHCIGMLMKASVQPLFDHEQVDLIKNLSHGVKALRALGLRVGQRGLDSAVEWVQEVGVFYILK